MSLNRRAAGLVAIVAALAVAAPAEAGSGTSKPTTVEIKGTGYQSDGTQVEAAADGRLRSVKRCLSHRVVKVYAFVGQSKRLIDVDRSSRHGYWGGIGTVPGPPDGYQVIAERTRRGKVVCREGSVAT